MKTEPRLAVNVYAIRHAQLAGIPTSRLRTSSRKTEVVVPRDAAIWDAYQAGHKQADIARYFKIDPSSIRQALERHRQVMDVDCDRPDVHKLITDLIRYGATDAAIANALRIHRIGVAKHRAAMKVSLQ